MEEAPFEEGMPTTDGWFIVNVADARWKQRDPYGKFCPFESPDHRFPHFGINIHVLEPGQAACHYHRESEQESFLVLSGEAKVIIENQERSLKQWDFVHCPPETNHLFVGAGTGPCAILMVGHRSGDTKLFYEVNELAAKYGGSSQVDTPDPRVSYGRGDPPETIEAPWPAE